MSASKIAKRYAKGIFDLALEQDRLEAVRTDLQSLYRLIGESADFAGFLEDPLLTPERRSDVLRALFADKVEVLVYKTILFLENKRRIGYLREICAAFEELYNGHRRILPVLIVSAKPIPDEQKGNIAAKLGAKFQQAIQTVVRVDASLLGGVKIVIGDLVLDYSLETQLHRLRKNILAA